MKRITYVLLSLVLTLPVMAGEPAPKVEVAMAELVTPEEAVDIESEVAEEMAKSAIRTSVRYYLGNATNHPMYREKNQSVFVENLYLASSEQSLPETLLPTIVFLESSYRMEAIGDRGEVGLTQVHGHAAEGCDLTTQLGQLRCGAKWLKKAYDSCGTWEGALTMYATGECRSKKEHVKKLIAFRLRLWKKVEALSYQLEAVGTSI
jgi:hypothetical protein